MNTTPQNILNSLREVIGHNQDQVLLHAPCLPKTANDYLQECVTTGWVSSAGSYVTKFEEQLANYTGASRAVAVVNGTAALEVALKLAGVQPNDEVLLPSLTFVATANAISHCGAIPHFIDVEEGNLGISPEVLQKHFDENCRKGPGGILQNLRSGRRIKALVPMHCFGHPCDMDSIVTICQEFGLELVEDAAESLGSFYRGKHTGRFGKLAAISFNGNKIITTGGGGAIITDDEEIANRAKHLTTTAKVAHPWEFNHDAIGWNFRMPNINAALGVAQLEILPKLLEAKRELAMRYKAAFQGIEGVEFIDEPEYAKSNFWLNAIRLKGADLAQRDAVLKSLNEAGYQSRPIWIPMHKLDIYSNCPRSDMKVTERLQAEIINIPSSAHLSKIQLP